MDPAIQKNYAQGYPGGNNNALRSDPTMAAMAVALDAVPVDSHQPWNFSVPATAVPHASAPPPSQQSINVEATKEFLTANGWAKGLQDTFISNLSKIPIRFIICDDSGSMSTNDGHKIVDLGRGNKKIIDCSRWGELTSALKFHAEIAKIAGAPTEFRLLNGAEPIMLGTGDDYDDSKYNSLMAVLDGSPGGGTPLCKHIRAVVDIIASMKDSLRETRQRACVIIASDGEASDGDIATAMRPLKDLPVWTVVRLCTDENRIVDYWNNIDSQLELEMDVLDDLFGEAEEVYQANPWLTYCEPIHRLREFGIPIKEIDLLDSNLLSLEQLRKVCSIIYGGSVESFPHPGIDWSAFVKAVEKANATEPQAWSATRKRNMEWIRVSKLNASYGKGCVIM